MAGKSNYDAEKQSRRGNRCLDGWRSGGWAKRRPSPLAPPPPPLPSLDTIQSEQSGVALSTFSSASKCQAVFARKHAHVGQRAVTLEEECAP